MKFEIPDISEIREVVRVTVQEEFHKNANLLTYTPLSLLSKKQAAERLGVCVSTVDNLRKEGVLRDVGPNAKVLFKSSDIDEYIRSL